MQMAVFFSFLFSFTSIFILNKKKERKKEGGGGVEEQQTAADIVRVGNE